MKVPEYQVFPLGAIQVKGTTEVKDRRKPWAALILFQLTDSRMRKFFAIGRELPL
jgi:hypothetical protein